LQRHGIWLVVEVYIHRDKIKCAIDLLKRGASQREIAKTCGLSLSQVSAIGREYGYYVEVREYFERLRDEKKREYEAWRRFVDEERRRLEAELRSLSERLRALRDEERALREIVEGLRHVKESLNREVSALLTALKKVCFHYQAYRAEAEKGLESLEKAIRDEVWKFLGEIEALTSPELVKDLAEFGDLLNKIPAPREYKEYLRGRFDKVASALKWLNALLHAREYFAKLVALAQLRDLCSIVDELKRARGEGS